MKNAITILIGCLLFSQAWAEQTTIAVAANFTAATREIVPLFEESTGHKIKASFGSTGKLYSQIENGAPFDLFLAADTKRPIKAEHEALAVKGSRFTYAKGKIVLWSITPGLFNAGGTYLKRDGFKHIAIANPKTAPYGLAAEQVMEKLGLWNTLQPKLVRGDTISQTFQFIVSGNVQAGFVALSQVKAWMGEQGSYWEIPQGDYTPIAQQAVLLKRGKDNAAARAFLDFLQGPQALAVISSYGYGVE